MNRVVVDDDEAEALPTISQKSTMLNSKPTHLASGPFKMMWDESVEVSDQSSGPSSESSSVVGDKSLDKVRNKLVAWSWAREQNNAQDHDDFTKPHWKNKQIKGGLSQKNPDERLDNPPAPPNTRKASEATSGGHSTSHFSSLNVSGTSSPFHNPISLAVTPEEVSHDVSPSDLKPGHTSAGPLPPPSGSNLSRQLKDAFSKAHRDSLDLAHERLESDKHGKPNQSLMTTRDSMIISKQRLERYPKSQITVDPRSGVTKMGGLSPILDASPPDVRSQQMALQHKRHAERKTPEIGGHPENDEDCSICEVERPRSRQSEGS